MSAKNKYKYLENAYPDILSGISDIIQKGKLKTRFENIVLSDNDRIILAKAKELCELKIIELWDNKDSEEFKALCSTYFDIAVLLELNVDNELFVYDQIKLIALGYLGEHWHFVKRYLKEKISVYESLDSKEIWNKRLLFTSFKAIVYLVKKDSWNDVKRAVDLINQLRNEQSNFESKFLNKIKESSIPYGAAELVSLYYFAKSIEILGQYLIEGKPLEPEEKIKYYINVAREFAQKSSNITLDLLFQFAEGLSIKMIRNTIWYSTRGINNWVSAFNKFIVKNEGKGIFELLYPQRDAIIKGELLNPAHRAIVLNLPTSSGKTLSAEYKILQALNQFRNNGDKQGWVAYLVPTKTLVNQIYVQLKKDFTQIGLKIEKASGAIELDGFEQNLVENKGDNTDFDILVTTYEKMNLLVRQGLGTTEKRPLVLVIIDEAHNLGDESRGLNLEMLLSTIRNDCEEANFLLMTPEISNSNEIVNWLAGDRGRVINLELDWWQPNERVIGAISVEGRKSNYDFNLITLHTDKGTYEIGDKITLVKKRDALVERKYIKSSKLRIASYLSSEILKTDYPIIVLASSVNDTYKIADILFESSSLEFINDEEIELVRKFIKAELGENFPLVKYLKKRIAIHSSALPDEIRFLIEDLMAKEKLKVLVATTTIAQGINFPVSAVVISSYNYPFKGPMPVRDFWNLAGRVGRVGQKSLGWIGVASRNNNDLRDIANYVKKASEDLVSQLVYAIENASDYAQEGFERWLWRDERWSAIFQYISHLRTQTDQLETFVAHLEEKLQRTFGYRQLSDDKRKFLKAKIREYAYSLTLFDAKKADETGFSTISLRQMIGRLAGANITPSDWNKNQLFSEHNQTMKKLVGIMLNTYEIRKSLEEISSGVSLSHSSIARLIVHWVNGNNIEAIAEKIFSNLEKKDAILKTTRALYKVIANAAVWGLAALQKLPTSGIDWENLSEIEKRKMANMPAYLYYGVNTDEGVLMRKNNVPRSIANSMGKLFKKHKQIKNIFEVSSSDVSVWLEKQDVSLWDKAAPEDSDITGAEYKKIWKKLNGE